MTDNASAEDRSILVVAGRGRITGYHRQTGAVVWEHLVQVQALGLTGRLVGAVDLAIHRGRVFALVKDRIICLDYLKGNVIGEVRLGSRAIRSTMVLDQEQLFVVSGSTVECFSLDGQLLWRAEREVSTDGPAVGFPGNLRQGDALGDS